MDYEALKLRINNVIDDWAIEHSPAPNVTEGDILEPVNEETTARELPADKRVVRVNDDRVYYLDETEKKRFWVTNPTVLESLGFELGDVQQITEEELSVYQQGPAKYKVDEA